MLKKSITFTDVDDKEVTEDHYFHLSKADLIKMEVSQVGGMQAYITQITESQDGKKIIQVFEDLIRMSYGQRTDEGRFVRNAQKTDEFMASEAYSELFMELVTDGTASAAFVNGIIPKGLEADVARIAKQGETPAPAAAPSDLRTEEDPTGLTNHTTPRVLTIAEIEEMDSVELKRGIASGLYKLS